MKFSETNLDHGYANRILTIDLGSGAIATPQLAPQLRDYFLGGRALGLYLLHKRVTRQTSPRDPENPLIFSPGPLAGIPQFPGTSKCMAVSPHR
jgi:aldehyde:ferredoxin oxidoreductase